MKPKATSLFDKIWAAHLVKDETPEIPAIMFIDLHLIHEVTSPQAFAELDARGLSVKYPERTFATIDHSTPTLSFVAGETPAYVSDEAKLQVEAIYENTQKHGITLNGWESEHRGVVHVACPELGLTQPGMTIVCGDSHTATHGAFGALAFGIGTTEVGHVLASQCLLQNKPESMRVTLKGKTQPDVSAKDIILAVIAKVGVNGGTGCVIEYTGEAITDLDMEGRMTVCNMSIEAGARAGLIAPDETTFAYLKGRPNAPKGDDWEKAVQVWRALKTDPDAVFDKEVEIDAASIRPMVTWGTAPDTAIPLGTLIPDGSNVSEERARSYMGFEGGQHLHDVKVDRVFIGSCTNARISDLRVAAGILKDKKIANSVNLLIVPGSTLVKQQAEAEGLDQVFKDAGADWREPGCSMCIGMNGDTGRPGEVVVSTSNRNFEGRQGPGVRTILASPATAAASAIAGFVTSSNALQEK